MACLVVILSHASGDGFHMALLGTRRFWALCLASTLGRSSIPLFFMLSGALLLSRERMDPWQNLKKRVAHMLGLFFVWSLAYALMRAVTGAFESFYDFAYAVVTGHYHLWFLPAMAVVYLFMPVVHAALHGGKLDGRYLLLLFFFLGVFLTNCNLTPDAAPILNRFTQIFSLDSLPYLGYAVWGWWLYQQEMPRRTLWLAPLVWLAALIAATQINFWYSSYRADADGLTFNFFSLPNVVMSTAAFCFFLALRGHSFRCARAVTEAAECTLGVYLLHPLVLNVLKMLGINIRYFHVPLDTLIRYLLLVVISFPLAWLLRKIPGIRKLLS